MWRSVILSLARPVVVALLNAAAVRVLANVDKTYKLSPAEREVARGAILELVQAIGAELGAKL